VTQGRPRPRPITAAWLVMPPRSVRHGLGRMHAPNILGRGFAAHKDTGLAARGLACAAAGGKDDPPVARTGLAAMPRDQNVAHRR
jgi:hypothetical protein